MKLSLGCIDMPPFLKRIRFILGSFYYTHMFNQSYSKSFNILSSIYNLYKDKTCFIVGTGNSLNNTDFSIIGDNYVFGVNTLFNGLNKYNLKTDFWVVGDDKVFRNHTEDILSVDCLKFIVGYAGRYAIKNRLVKDDTILIKPLYDNYLFSKDLIKGIYYGGTVVYLCLQIAFYLGFKKVFLIGCDCDYSGVHHFDGSDADMLFGMAGGYYDKSFSFYRLAKKVFEGDGRKIINATVGGKLEVFDRSVEEFGLS